MSSTPGNMSNTPGRESEERLRVAADTRETGARAVSEVAGSVGRDRASVVERERARFGGVKAGSAFFGWLTATGTAVLLTAVASAAGSAVALATGNTVNSVKAATTAVSNNATTVGIAGGVTLAVIILLAYFCGGYVAGRMARFDGAKQGVAVWVWAVVIAAVAAIVGAVAGTQYNVLSKLNSFPRIPIHEGHLTGASILAAVLFAVAALIGAVLGGLTGMRFHRRVDRVGFGS